MRNNGVRIPSDVAACIGKKRAIRVSVFVLIEIALIVAAVLYGSDIFGGAHPAVSYLIYAVLMILPGYWLKIPFWLFDKTFAGEIISKEEETYNAIEGRARSIGWHTNKLQRLGIRLDSGKVIEYIIYDNRARHAFRNTTYNVGDRVIHVGGTRYLQAVAVGEDDTLICVVCGTESRAETAECPVCGKTLKID